ncbi:peptidoglycan pentaglycine glycine transferase (the first glycine) [Knoellia remsis]|uniref:Peptidoglycan pentaglycine glycine transferase (The first glycine) n=1 Tax=Knoellia remsis TaxID=407159 RepID=A0A2T0UJI6_9MICO|nr:peptidoglycan bridge formation glycyltransferase FemA/FemB family protein [Knoellia remsis]PRY58044.1 peptidoglycan pentaglycine glycine transferase (the first glycine) [Knoellia remsis]
MALVALDLTDREHDDFVRDHPNGHLMQTTPWGREKVHTGWTWKTVAVGRKGAGPDGADEVTGAALILFRRAPVLPMALAYCPRGFVVDWADGESVDALLAEVTCVAKANRGVLLRLDPAVRIDDPDVRPALESRGFERTDPGDDAAKTLAQPALRMVTGISDLDGLLAGLSQSTRQSIRKGEKSGLVYESVGRDKIPAFYELMKVTGQRDGFGIRSMEYFTTLYDVLSPTDDIVISLVKLDHGAAAESARTKVADLTQQLEKARAKREKYPSEKADRQVAGLEESVAKNEASIAEYEAAHAKHPDGQYLSGSVFATCGTRGSYLYAASSDDYRNLRPNYLMVWRIMQDAAAKGVTTFDFGGIDASEGLEEFKKQWNPERREYAGEFTKRLRPLSGRLIDLVVRVYKRR